MAKDEFLNPFDKGVSYEAFLKEVDKSKKTVSEYCKNKLTNDEVDFIEKELKLIKLNKK